jgi:hypothetical protein
MYLGSILGVAILITCLIEWGLVHFKIGIYDPSKNTSHYIKGGISAVIILMISALALSHHLSILTYGHKAMTQIITKNDYSSADQLMDIYENPELAQKNLLFTGLTHKDVIELTFFNAYSEHCAKTTRIQFWFQHPGCQSKKVNSVYFKLLQPNVINVSYSRLGPLVTEYPKMQFQRGYLTTYPFKQRYSVDDYKMYEGNVYKGLEVLVSDSKSMLNQQPYAAVLAINAAVNVLDKRKEEQFKTILYPVGIQDYPARVPRALAGYDAYYKTLVNLCYTSNAPMDCKQLTANYKQYAKSLKATAKAWKSLQQSRPTN